jgi:hypothetical protein
VICPVQSALQKYFASLVGQIRTISCAVLSREEGRWPSSRTLGRDAVDAAASCVKIDRRAACRERSSSRQTSDAKAYGKTVWSWHPLLVLNWRRCCEPNRARQNLNPPMTVTRGIRRRGERGISRKAIAQGRRNAPTVPVCSCACSYAHIARETAGAASTRRSLRPLISWAKRFAKPGRNAPREGGGVFDGRERHIFGCHRPRRRAIQYSRDVSDRTEKPRRTGSPACAWDDSCVWGSFGSQ